MFLYAPPTWTTTLKQQRHYISWSLPLWIFPNLHLFPPLTLTLRRKLIRGQIQSSLTLSWARSLGTKHILQFCPFKKIRPCKISINLARCDSSCSVGLSLPELTLTQPKLDWRSSTVQFLARILFGSLKTTISWHQSSLTTIFKITLILVLYYLLLLTMQQYGETWIRSWFPPWTTTATTFSSLPKSIVGRTSGQLLIRPFPTCPPFTCPPTSRSPA